MNENRPLMMQKMVGGLPLITYAPRGRGRGSSLLCISIAYYMQKKGGGEGVHKACKNSYVINGRPLVLSNFSFFSIMNAQ